MYNPDDLQPINRNYIIIGILVLFVFSGITYSLVTNNQTAQPKPITSTQPSNGNNSNLPANLSKYDEDSDGDKIPNFMEEFLGTNAYSSEVNDCEKTNFVCSETPLNKVHNINVILDASTSMKIVGFEGTKIDEVRQGMKESLVIEFTAPYYKLSIYSFGNRGTLENIPDNESCVSILRHKNLNTPSSDPRFASKDFLDNYLPNGKSPLAFTLTEVSKTLSKDENNLILLITDSLDDCNGDVKRALSEIKNSGNAKRIDALTYFANEDANIYLREVIESNGGNFGQNVSIRNFLVDSSRNFIKQNWCKYNEVQKIKNCIDSKYKTANSYLNDQKNNRNLGEDEKIKISNTQSVMSFHQESNIRRYQTNLDEEFNTYFKKKD